MKSRCREQQRQLLRKDASQRQREDPNIRLAVSRHVPTATVHLRSRVVIVRSLHRKRTERLCFNLEDRKSLAGGTREYPDIWIEYVEREYPIRCQVPPHHSEGSQDFFGRMEVQQRVACDEN